MNAELLLADKVYSETIKANMGNEKERNRISKDYQMQRLEIIRQFNQKAFEEETKVLEASLDSTELTEKQKNDIRDAIRKLAMKNAKEITDYEIDMTKYKIDTMTTLEEEFNKFLNDKRTKAVQQMWSTAMDMANMYYDNELKRIDGLEKKDKEKYDAQLKLIEENKEAGSISDEEADARKRIIEASQAEREKQYEEQRKQIQQKQARWQKANAIIQATISTAGAVAAALPNVVLAAIVGAMGAAQVAMIASQQVPQYKEGTKGGTDAHPGGPAIVGDGGRSEMVILPDGRIWKTPAHDTLVSLPRGTEVLPDFKKACLEAAMRQPIPLAMDEGRGQTVFIQDEVIRKNTGDAVTEMREFNQNMRSFRKNSMYSENKLRIHKTLSKWR